MGAERRPCHLYIQRFYWRKALPAYCARAKNGAELRITWKPDKDQCRSHKLGVVVAFGIGVSAVGYWGMGMGDEGGVSFCDIDSHSFSINRIVRRPRWWVGGDENALTTGFLSPATALLLDSWFSPRFFRCCL